MNPRYVPILRTKQGEFEAYSLLEDEIKRETLPLFELSQFTDTMRARVRFQTVTNPLEIYIGEVAAKIHAAVGSSSVITDIFKWAPNSTIENGEHVLAYLTSCLTGLGSSVIPVIGYERWGDREYSSVLKGLSSKYSQFCLRLESYAFEDMVEERHFLENINDIIDSMGLDVTKCCLILDFGATQLPIVDIEEKLSEALALLSPYKFGFISIAGCSVTVMVNDMVSERDTTGLVVRKEMIVWKSNRRFNAQSKLVFGDYGVVNPDMKDDVKAKHANCKIRYTTQEKHFVVRGHSKQEGWDQMYGLCQTLMGSPYYLYPSFSWGDAQIEKCANGKFTGNATKWVSFDLNHHITYVIAEVFEVERSLEVGKVKAIAKA
ncbi:beta family protein [Shewanella sp. A32]|uniref:beta family protein n=1 Tax=Shewanella sp. A32 TaxID=3031327 RepID=UPI0023B98C4B|nr:beta family protein [Shewanella sp. A32]MDF0535024.1 beta family protein [Shewanella sp. A32]